MAEDEEDAIEEAYDRWFNPYRKPKTDRAKALVEDVAHQLQAYERHRRLRKRARKPNDQEVFEASVSAIVCDVIHHALSDCPSDIAITRSNTVLGRKSRYRPEVYGKTLPSLLDHLASPEMSFIEQRLGHEGVFGPARSTTIRAGKRLLSRIKDYGITLDDLEESKAQEVIILNGAKLDRKTTGDRQEYEDTETTRKYRDQMRAINSWLEEADIIFEAGLAGVRHSINDQDRYLRRIFTQGRFDCGGRLFGGFWQGLRKRERLEGLFIQGEEVTSLDYSQMGPRLLYGYIREQPPSGDAYLIPGLEDHRAGVKTVFNSMLFATKPLSRKPQGSRLELPSKMSYPDIANAIMNRHPLLKEHFYKGIGHKLQFLESQIMVDILLALKGLGIVALPVHDAVIIPMSWKDETIKQMSLAFYKWTGLKGEVQEEGVSDSVTKDSSLPRVSSYPLRTDSD